MASCVLWQVIERCAGPRSGRVAWRVDRAVSALQHRTHGLLPEDRSGDRSRLRLDTREGG